MPPFLPPDSRRLRDLIIKRNARRATRAARLLSAPAECRARLRAHLRGTPGDLLYSPRMRAWLCQAEEAIAYAQAGRSARRLFEPAAGGAHLAALAPSGRLDAGFVQRARKLGARLMTDARRDLSRALDPPLPRVVIPGTAIAVTGGARKLPLRLAAALELVRKGWPTAHAEVLEHTRAIVPITQRATVSYSLKTQPGVSYINVRGKRLVDLADDLVHETAHHRLHGLEELSALHRDDGEPRYWSPWRRSLRPLQGILHAAYTFMWRAELLARLLRLPPRRVHPVRRGWLRAELAFEREALRRSVGDLEDAAARRLLTRDGARIAAALRARLRGLTRSRAAGPSPRR